MMGTFVNGSWWLIIYYLKGKALYLALWVLQIRLRDNIFSKMGRSMGPCVES